MLDSLKEEMHKLKLPCGCVRDGHLWVVECETHAPETTELRAAADRLRQQQAQANLEDWLASPEYLEQ